MAAPKGHAPYNTKGEGGRKMTYDVEKETDALEEWMKDKNNVLLEDFCYERGYHDSRIFAWMEKPEYQRLRDTIELFRVKQKSFLIKGGLFKKLHYGTVQLLLGHSHGIYLKTEQKVSGDSSNPLAFIISENDGTSKDLINVKSNEMKDV